MFVTGLLAKSRVKRGMSIDFMYVRIIYAYMLWDYILGTSMYDRGGSSGVCVCDACSRERNRVLYAHSPRHSVIIIYILLYCYIYRVRRELHSARTPRSKMPLKHTHYIWAMGAFCLMRYRPAAAHIPNYAIYEKIIFYSLLVMQSRIYLNVVVAYSR